MAELVQDQSDQEGAKDKRREGPWSFLTEDLSDCCQMRSKMGEKNKNKNNK